jgi:hypothetical protein
MQAACQTPERDSARSISYLQRILKTNPRERVQISGMVYLSGMSVEKVSLPAATCLTDSEHQRKLDTVPLNNESAWGSQDVFWGSNCSIPEHEQHLDVGPHLLQ